jgi:hypothetical protein
MAIRQRGNHLLIDIISDHIEHITASNIDTANMDHFLCFTCLLIASDTNHIYAINISMCTDRVSEKMKRNREKSKNKISKNLESFFFKDLRHIQERDKRKRRNF